MNLWNKLAVLFLPTRRLVGEHPDSEGNVSRGGPFGGQQWVVGRGECQYRREDLQALPVRRRLQAGKLAAGRHRPSPSSLVCTAWTGGVAHFWFWDAPLESKADVGQRWIPDSLLLPPPEVDGLRLLKLPHGYEAQSWHGGVLAGSQWWEQMPTGDAWLRFVRSAGLDPAAFQNVPDPVQLPWSRQPWGETSWIQRLTGLLDEKTAWLLLAAALAAGLGWQLSSLLRWQAAGDQLAGRVERMRAEVAPLLAAREQAEQAQLELERLQALRTPHDDYVLMANVIARLPEGSTLVTWRREADKLQVVVRSSETDPRAFVVAFEGDPGLSNVAVTPLTGGTMQLAFELPAAAGAAASGGERHE